jgi:hypothetical protein
MRRWPVSSDGEWMKLKGSMKLVIINGEMICFAWWCRIKQAGKVRASKCKVRGEEATTCSVCGRQASRTG